MTFWHWLHGMKGMTDGPAQGDMPAAINELPDGGILYPTGAPESVAEVQDALTVRGFTPEQIKSAIGQWTQYRRLNTQP